MNCSEFVGRFTDYHDGLVSAEGRAAMDGHVAGCGACRRYVDVVEKGAALLRALPSPELREDFGPRLQHRLYHVDDEGGLAVPTASGTTALTVLGMAILLTAVAWSPALRAGAPAVELEAIVVSRPPSRSPARPANALPVEYAAAVPLANMESGLWDDALLYEYSPLSQRYRRHGAVRRVSLERDR